VIVPAPERSDAKTLLSGDRTVGICIGNTLRELPPNIEPVKHVYEEGSYRPQAGLAEVRRREDWMQSADIVRVDGDGEAS
jgi:hypothetical protein